MDEKKIEDKLKKIWEATPVSHSDAIKEASWQEFQSKTFASKKPKFKVWHYAAAAVVIIFMSIGTGIYFHRGPLTNDIYFSSNVIENTTSIMKVVTLPDRSSVELSPNSKILYAHNFEQNRKIELHGEAYFKVRKDNKHPFQVFCKETTTTVLGTSFTIKEDHQNGMSVELYEGSVQMNVKDQDKKWLLKPGEKFRYANNSAAVSQFNRFTDFENEKLSTVSAYVMTNYGYKMTIPQEYDNQRITVRINKKEDLKTIVKLLSEMYNLKFEINEELKQITFR